MLKYLENFLAEFDYPAESRPILCTAQTKLLENEEFCLLTGDYYLESDLFERLDSIAKTCDVHKYTVHLLYLIGISKKTKELYRQKNISDGVFFDSMCDLKYKLKECIDVHGIHGTFVGSWFPRFFRLTRFALGRFQYETIEFGSEYQKDGVTVKKGDIVLNVHIPSSGPMPEALILDSYKRAAEFYADEFIDRPVIFVCNSWLLFPKHREFLPKTSNILRFMDDYDVISEKEDAEFKNLWRFFGKQYSENIQAMPADNSLRRAYIDWISKGNAIGTAFGIYIYKN